jgi:hypothetical protein
VSSWSANSSSNLRIYTCCSVSCCITAPAAAACILGHSAARRTMGTGLPQRCTPVSNCTLRSHCQSTQWLVCTPSQLNCQSTQWPVCTPRQCFAPPTSGDTSAVVICRTGQIDAVEFKDRFFGIYGREQAAQQLYMEISLLVPNPARRMALLMAAPNVSARNISPLLCCTRCCLHNRLA